MVKEEARTDRLERIELGEPVKREMICRRSVRNIVLFGPPGVGKGVQARMLADRAGLGYLSTGDIIRDEIQRGTQFGRRVGVAIAQGKFADDETILEIVQSRVDGANLSSGFILDGFPRTVRQAEMLDRILSDRGRSLQCALFLRASERTILQRLAGRLVCSDCGCSFHSAFRRPQVVGVCDGCGGRVTRRSDDAPETHRRRLKIFEDVTASLQDYYTRQGLLSEVNSDESVDEVARRIAEAIGV